MRPSSRAALALLLLSAQPAPAQAPLPPGFVDAAAVVDGLIVDMRYFGANNFVGERIDGYERPRCLLSVPAANALAAVERDLSVRGLGRSIATGRSARSPDSCAGRSGSRTSSANANSIPTRTSASCSRKAIFPIAPVTRAARPSISRWCGARTPASSIWARRSISSARNRGRRIEA